MTGRDLQAHYRTELERMLGPEGGRRGNPEDDRVDAEARRSDRAAAPTGLMAAGATRYSRIAPPPRVSGSLP